MRYRTFRFVGLISAILLPLPLAGCGIGDLIAPPPVEWPISKDVFLTTQRQVLPVAVSPNAPPVNPRDVSLYETFGYSAWHVGPGTNYSQGAGQSQPYDKRTDLAPGYGGAANEARLLSFFAITDIHLTDKESPAQPIYPFWNKSYGADSAGCSSGYSPVILSTTHVLDAAIQTVNALHEQTPFDFGISLGDDVNNTQYNELRWFIDVLDGKVITPSSGAHDGEWTIDYQRPYKAAGLNKAIPWYQAIGNHDQFWSGSAYEFETTLKAHVGSTIVNMGYNYPADLTFYLETGAYMGVVDGSTPYGDIIGAGPVEYFATPPTVAADKNRRSLVTDTSSSLNWMKEFFKTASKPVGHGFTKANLDNDFACYSFVPKSDVPIKVIVLDDTVKGKDQPNYAAGGLDQARLDWLTNELDQGQANGQLMIIAAHVPINPQNTLAANSGNTPILSSTSVVTDAELLAILHNYPNLILWIAGHRHVNVVTAQPSPDPVNHPEQGFWQVETASLRDFPQQFRTFDIRRNGDNTISIMITDVDPAVAEGSPAAKSRGYAVGIARICGATPASIADTTSHAYNAELIKQLTPEMQAKIATYGSPLGSD